MPFFDESHRAPAEIPQKGYISALNRLLSRAADFCLPCQHKNTTLPFNDRQTCLDCGATRLYILTYDFEHADSGIFIGKWHKAAKPQSAAEMVAKTLIATAIAPQPPRPPATPRPTHCRDCGKELDHFGACPSALPMDLIMQHAPVNCGETPVVPESAPSLLRAWQQDRELALPRIHRIVDEVFEPAHAKEAVRQ